MSTTPNYDLYKPAVNETGWGDLVDANCDIIDTQLKVNADAVVAEAATRASAVTTEATTRSAADIILLADISAEASTRAYADTTLQTSITTEATTRAAADSTEAVARAAADALLAPLASPALTGVPVAPTASALTSTTQISTTAYADAAVAVEKTRALTAEATKANTSSLATVATTGNYTDLLGTPVLAATIAASAHKVLTAYDATTGSFTQAQLGEADITGLVSDLALLAPLASPALTGNPTVPTQSALTNSTRAASTAYADAAVGVENTRALAAEALKANTSSLATVATTGSYTDLTDKPQLAVTNTGGTHNFLTAYDSTTGLFTKAQPAFTDVSGSATLAQLPTGYTWDKLGNAAGALTLANGDNNTTVNQTSATTWTWANTAATVYAPPARGTGATNVNFSNASSTLVNVNVGDCVIVTVWSTTVSVAGGVTDNGTGGSNTYVQIGSTVSGNGFSSMWSCLSAVHVATTITANFTAGQVGAITYTGVSAIGTNSSATGTSTAPTTTLTPSGASSSIILGVITCGTGVTQFPTTATSIAAQDNFTIKEQFWYIAQGAGSATISATLGVSSQWNAMAVELKAVTSATVSQASPILSLVSTYWNGAASAADTWTIQNVLSAVPNGASTLTFTHAGSTGTASVKILGGLSQVNSTVATVSSVNASPVQTYSANYWATGAVSAPDTWTMSSSLIAGLNGASRLNIVHTGSTGQASVVFPNGASASPSIVFASSLTTGFFSGANSIAAVCGAVNTFVLASNIVRYVSTAIAGFSSGDPGAAGTDTALFRSAAGVLGICGSSAATPADLISPSANGASWRHGQNSELLTLSTVALTTDTVGNLLPAGAIIDAVVCRVTTALTTTTNWAVGDANQAARFSSANATLTLGTTSVGLNQADPTVASSNLGPVQAAAAKVRITCTGSNPGAGVIRITVFYRQFVAPTS